MMFCSIVPFKKQNYLLLWKVISKNLEKFSQIFVSGIIIYDQKKGLTVQFANTIMFIMNYKNQSL